jgi:hypothetical protein
MPDVKLRIRAVPRSRFDDALLGRLHELSDRLLTEDPQHFRVHAVTNEVVHVFERSDTGALVGFQFWSTGAIARPRSRTIVGGKLRVEPAFRNRGLHLTSGLRFYLACQLRAPATRFYRLSLASLFGFVSVTSALAEYQLLDPRASDDEGRAVWAAFERLANDSHYQLDAETGLAYVNIRPTPEVLAQFAPGYFGRPEARIYARANPGWRDNGRYVAFWFRFTPRNLAALGRAIWRKTRAAARDHVKRDPDRSVSSAPERS